MIPKIRNLLYQGKAKDVYQTDDPEMVVVKFRDDITAGDGDLKATLGKKGYYNSIISAKLFELLEASNIKTQYIKLLKPGEMLACKLDMIPLEIITRNIATGSLIKKFPFHENQELQPPIIQMDYKSDEYHDPMLNDDIAMALGLTTKKELEVIRQVTLNINEILTDFLRSKNIMFPDFKIEYGRNKNNEIILGDEISPDTCRFWDMETYDILDKDLFRKGKTGVMEAYHQVALRMINENDEKKWNLDLKEI